MYGMNDTEIAMYKASYDLHRIFYETAEESRDAGFWGQIQDGLSAIGKFNSQGTVVQILIQDVLIVYGQHGNSECIRANMEREKTLAREREEIAKAESRKKRLAEIERLESELEKARAGL